MAEQDQFRALTESDANAFRDLRLHGLKKDPRAFGASYETESVRSLTFFRDRCTATSDKAVFGAFDDDCLIAISSVVREMAPKCRHYASIFSVYTHPDYRAQGLSSRLLALCIQRARSWPGLDFLQLGVATDNTAALTLYQRAGFQICGTLPAALRVDGEDVDEHILFLRLT